MTDSIANVAKGQIDGTKTSPLIRVLSQVRWPTLTGFEVDEVAAGLAKKIGRDYPRHDKVHGMQLVITPEGVTEQPGENLHRFQSVDESWIVTLSATFITLETTRYKSHEDFIPRFGRLIGELTSVYPIPLWERFGYRYTNRISDEHDIEDLAALFDRSVLGLYALAQPDDVLQHSVTEAVLEGSGASLLVRSAYLQAGASIDPTIPALQTRAWFLDLDAFSGAEAVALTKHLAEQHANMLSEKAHAFFEKVTTNEYRHRYA